MGFLSLWIFVGFVPPIESIDYQAFWYCESLKLIILPHYIDLGKDGDELRELFLRTDIEQIAKNADVAYEYEEDEEDVTEESNRQVKEWLIRHMDDSPFHKICYDSSICQHWIAHSRHERALNDYSER